jgi:hypothetical protein
LAIAQAGTFMSESGMRTNEYVALIQQGANRVLDEGAPVRYGKTLASVTRIAAAKIRAEKPQAMRLLGPLSLLAPERVPFRWLLALNRSSELEFRTSLTLLRRYGLIRLADDGDPTLHRAIAAIIRDSLRGRDLALARRNAETLLTSAAPPTTEDPASWPEWAALQPHLAALSPATSTDDGVRLLARRLGWNLLERGDPRAARTLAGSLFEDWTVRFGAEHLETLEAGNVLSRALGDLGEFGEAIAIGRKGLRRATNTLGPDDENTLRFAHNLAFYLRSLGDLESARELDQDTWERRRRVLGESHIDTLRSAHNLAIDQRQLGRAVDAELMDRRTFELRAATLGERHPHSLASAVNLARDLHEIGDHQGSRERGEKTLADCQDVLGLNHPFTLACLENLVDAYMAMGMRQPAARHARDLLLRRSATAGDQHPDIVRIRRLVDQLASY